MTTKMSYMNVAALKLSAKSVVLFGVTYDISNCETHSNEVVGTIIWESIEFVTINFFASFFERLQSYKQTVVQVLELVNRQCGRFLTSFELTGIWVEIYSFPCIESFARFDIKNAEGKIKGSEVETPSLIERNTIHV